ncbi:hypothetical protein [Clostridium tagluense]|uniref:Uncharacterized protein n=1 Tax=Clostridium tagluense TaxID=360422 RepID=A0A401UQB8_9CLOT|nr:hypothetical protein [Clostridium tagluense]GCD11729.1 hypothetical protein Ctaglu_33520 [Clostridium tagluense]
MLNKTCYFSEFLDILENPQDHLSEDGINLLYDLTEEKNLKGVLNFIHCEIQVHRFENHKCPDCGEDFKTNTYQENRGDCRGQPCSESIYYNECDCGWNNKSD